MDSFSPFEARIRAAAARLPGAPASRTVLSRLVVHLQKRLETVLGQVLDPHGLTPPGWAALMLMYSDPHDELNPCDVSAMTVLSRTNVTRLIDDLVARGWVQRRAAQDDRRRVLLSLTPAGIALVETVLPPVRDLYQALWDGFDDAETALYERLSRKLVARLDALDAAAQPAPVNA